MKTLLITGFDPFGGENINPSWEAVKRLPDVIGNCRVQKMQIPTVFGEAAQTVLRQAEELKADIILSVGQAGGRAAVTPERIGINIRSASIADNKGNMPQEQPIVPGGSDGIFATVPVAAMVESIKEAGLPGAVSNSAGTFVCNDVLYTLLHHFAGTATQVGFIHVPYLPEQGTPSLSLEDTVRALERVILVL